MGFNVSAAPGLGFVPLFGVCHNVDLGATLYAAHKLHGAAIDAAQDESKRPHFAQGLSELFVGYSPDDAYKKVGRSSSRKINNFLLFKKKLLYNFGLGCECASALEFESW